MPYNRAANIRRRLRQVDFHLVRAMRFMADVMVTVGPQHPELGVQIYSRLFMLDFLRQYHLAFYREHWSGTERGLWKPGELDIIISEASILPADRHLGKGHRTKA